ncbi:MAG: hypothetical protein HY940_06940 [Gammaproteobacteria bacterium]|nr:hypothetical protein [Gammaproteobacteria bacterium]
MRQVAKGNTPNCLQAFIDAQLAIKPEPVNLTYRDFPYKSALCETLTREQYGLCGYTGAPVDERITQLQPAVAGPSFRNHIEHLKCQQACRDEVTGRDEEYGRVVGDDLNYRNMIAALEVRGAEVEHFGAVAKAARTLPVLPTHEDCEERFVFREGDGSVDGLGDTARTSISVLALNHDTLKGWRLSALSTWLDPLIVQTREDFMDVLQAVTTPNNERLPEYAFVIESVAKGYINENDL